MPAGWTRTNAMPATVAATVARGPRLDAGFTFFLRWTCPRRTCRHSGVVTWLERAWLPRTGESVLRARYSGLRSADARSGLRLQTAPKVRSVNPSEAQGASDVQAHHPVRPGGPRGRRVHRSRGRRRQGQGPV